MAYKPQLIDPIAKLGSPTITTGKIFCTWNSATDMVTLSLYLPLEARSIKFCKNVVYYKHLAQKKKIFLLSGVPLSAGDEGPRVRTTTSSKWSKLVTSGFSNSKVKKSNLIYAWKKPYSLQRRIHIRRWRSSSKNHRNALNTTFEIRAKKQIATTLERGRANKN